MYPVNSKWYKKAEAVALRKKGTSIRTIEKILSVPRSTVSGWVRDVELTMNQKARLRKSNEKGLEVARTYAILWHNKQKYSRLQKAEQEAKKILQRIPTNSDTKELALAFLYLGEGHKSSPETRMGNSNPEILRFFITILRSVYFVPTKNIRCDLHLRADQQVTTIKRYWSKELKLPMKNFISTYKDHRTSKTKTYDSYKGVCVVRCGRADIQRRLLALGTQYCSTVTTGRIDYLKNSDIV